MYFLIMNRIGHRQNYGYIVQDGTHIFKQH